MVVAVAAGNARAVRGVLVVEGRRVRLSPTREFFRLPPLSKWSQQQCVVLLPHRFFLTASLPLAEDISAIRHSEAGDLVLRPPRIIYVHLVGYYCGETADIEFLHTRDATLFSHCLLLLRAADPLSIHHSVA